MRVEQCLDAFPRTASSIASAAKLRSALGHRDVCRQAGVPLLYFYLLKKSLAQCFLSTVVGRAGDAVFSTQRLYRLLALSLLME